MKLDFLLTDYLIFLLFFGAIVFIFYARTQPHLYLPWKKVFEKKTGIVTSIILCFYIGIGLLDSIHIEIHAQQKSVLDILVNPLGSQDEKTYSKPFSLYLQQSDQPERLKFGGAMLKNPDQKTQDIIMRALTGFGFGLSSFIFIFLIWRYFFKKNNNIGMITFCFAWVFIFILAFLATHYHIFGTNKIGQDVFYESIKSIRTGLLIGTLTTIFMLPFALFCGTIAGYFGGLADDIIQYFYITLSSIPGVLLITAMVLITQIYIADHPHLFPSINDRADARLLMLCFILGITSWASLCRLLRAETLKLREQEFVTASIAMGAKRFFIIFKHILPNVMHIVLITIVLDFSGLVLAEAILSYVGVGVDPTTISWGNMINISRLELAREPIVWWPLLAALIGMFALVLSANLFSDVVRDAFDPKLR